MLLRLGVWRQSRFEAADAVDPADELLEVVMALRGVTLIRAVVDDGGV